MLIGKLNNTEELKQYAASSFRIYGIPEFLRLPSGCETLIPTAAGEYGATVGPRGTGASEKKVAVTKRSSRPSHALQGSHYPFLNNRHGVTFQSTSIFITTAATTSNRAEKVCSFISFHRCVLCLF